MEQRTSSTIPYNQNGFVILKSTTLQHKEMIIAKNNDYKTDLCVSFKYVCNLFFFLHRNILVNSRLAISFITN